MPRSVKWHGDIDLLTLNKFPSHVWRGLPVCEF